MNPVQAGSFLTLHYRLCGPDGDDLVNTFNDKPATLSMGEGQLSPALEQRLLGLEEGTRAAFDLAAGEAFGEHNAELMQWLKLSLLRELGDPDEAYNVGDVVRFPGPDGQGGYAGVVCEVGESAVLFDFNHPLAGRPVRFEVQLIGVL
jgi:FKBP-type peptidyl-prolyl cis-trans isomerase SlpA